MSAARLRPGNRIPSQHLIDVNGAEVNVPDSTRLVHLQFRRFAGCPVCELHLQSFQRRSSELQAAGVREVVLFHSSAEALREHAADALPFAVVADPARALYRAFAVESGARALLDPRAIPTIARAIGRSVLLIARGERKAKVPDAASGRLGLPADFLIGNDGQLLACKYGEHVYDQWSVDDVLAEARTRAQQVAAVT